MRRPAVAGHFYPAYEAELRESLRNCFLGPFGPGRLPVHGAGGDMVAALSPHAGIMASGMGAAHVYDAISRNGLAEVYVIIGPKHHHRGWEVSLCDQPFSTPLGICALDEEVLGKMSQRYEVNNRAHAREHSIEMQVIFLQYIHPAAKIVPILMGDQSEESAADLAEGIREACGGRRAMVIASGDMSHYVPKQQAMRDDRALIDRMLELDVPGMYEVLRERRISACGYGPTAAAIMATHPGRAQLLKQMDSGDVFDSEEVVGYASVAFYKE